MRLPSLGIAMLRNQLTRELHRRMACIHAGEPYWSKLNEAPATAEAVPGCDMGRGGVEMAAADQDALREAQEPKEGGC